MTDAIVILPRAELSRARLAAAQYLAAYSGNTFVSYQKDLDILFKWCEMFQLDPLEATRAHLELFSRHLVEERGNKPASVYRRLCTVKCFYRMCVYDDIIVRSPADHVRYPKIFQDDTRTLGIDKSDLMAMIGHAKSTTPHEYALVSLMGLMGLRVSEACSVLIENCNNPRRGHRTIYYIGKGGKPANDPLAVPLARAVDAAAGDRTRGPLLLRPDGVPMDRRHAARVVSRLARQCGVDLHITPHMYRHSYVTQGLDMGLSIRDMQLGARHADPRTTMLYDTNRQSLDRHPNYVIAARLAGA